MPKSEVYTEGMLPGDFSATIEKDGARVGIVGLNTAFLQLMDDNFEGRLALHVRQFHKATGGHGPDWVRAHDTCLLLTHHPPDWLTEEARRTHLEGEIHSPPRRFVLHLFGHMHEPELRTVALGGADARRRLQGCSLFAVEGWGEQKSGERIHGYSIGQLDVATARMRIWPRRAYERQGGGRQMDRDVSFSLPRGEDGTEWMPVALLGSPTRSLNGDDTAPPPPAAVWNIPYARNSFFTGRSEILDTIRGALEDTIATALTQAISGLGGIGKTQTAVEYAYRHGDNYEAVFWAVADKEVTIISAYAEIARLLNLPDAASPDQNRIVETVKRWFETHDKWLLLLDNADSPSLVRAFLSLSPRGGHILISSRAQNLDMLGIPRTLDLQEMSPHEALEFLLKRTGREDTDARERQAAAELAEKLGWLPLALEQAGAYIAAHQARFEDYLASFERIRTAANPGSCIAAIRLHTLVLLTSMSLWYVRLCARFPHLAMYACITKLGADFSRGCVG